MGSIDKQQKEPNDSPQPSSSTSTWEIPAISADTFYVAKGTNNPQTYHSQSSNHSKRPEQIGSSHTVYAPPSSTEEQGGLSYSIPGKDELVPVEEDDMHQSTYGWPANGFNTDPNAWHTGTGYTSGIRLVEDMNDISITGRSEQEEKEWWDPDSTGNTRPGPGMLPPLVADDLHNPEHSLFSVSAKCPDIQPPSPSMAKSTPTDSPHSSPQPVQEESHSRKSSASLTAPPFLPPSQQECHEAIPHPNAYYCRRHHGWVILAWRSSCIVPPLAPSFTENNHHPLPEKDRRIRGGNCLSKSVYGRANNKTHHFHKYSKAVDAAHMTPQYSPRSWELTERTKKSRRRMTIGADHLDPTIVSQAVAGDPKSQHQTQMVTETREEEESHDLLDLYVCCQCPLYVLVSDIIPGVFASKYVEDLYKERFNNPPVGFSGEQSVYMAWETIQTAIENKLWKGNEKALAVNGRIFTSRLGWSDTVSKLFESIGFRNMAPSSPSTSTSVKGSVSITLAPPRTDLDSEEGRANRERMLRAWVEIGAYLADFLRRFPKASSNSIKTKQWIKVESAREMYQDAIGAHPDQIKRYQYSDIVYTMPRDDVPWAMLGLTRSTYDSALLQFAYYAQCRCDPAQTPLYLSALTKIVLWLRNVVIVPQELENLIVSERSRGRFTEEDFITAIRMLGFGSDNWLRVDYDEDVDDVFLQRAWKDVIRRSWNDPEHASVRRDLNEAFRIIAEWRRSPQLIKALADELANGMTPEKAYNTLEVPIGVDEEMLITVYNMRVEDQPSQLEKMRDALRCIAEVTYSERLTKFLESGVDPGVAVAPTHPHWPRGLNQLGNTCYLNSLLQYFYTIKDLRDAIVPSVPLDDKYVDFDEVKEDDLKNHRVGGRLVSRHEVVRSRKFVSQLANLFWHLENSGAPSVTPSLELAKLALVTSKDEEEDDPERGGTDSSHSTDATLVDEPAPSSSLRDSPQPMPKQSTAPESPSSALSVLGKRSRGISRKRSGSLDSQTATSSESVSKDYVMVPELTSSTDGLAASGAHTPSTVNEVGTPSTMKEDNDVEMVDREAQPASNEVAVKSSKAPPLPPRPKAQFSASEMMFGRQHDVAECMDNCMFQIETALLRFGGLAGSDDSKRSIVKRLFYGKIRQRLSLPPDPSRSKSSQHEREDYFSHLPVNVSEESFDLYDGLSGYFDDVVEFEGTKAKMEVSLVELPPILQIQLQRVQFNRETLQPFKSNAYVKFGETIYMDRFLDDAPEEKKAKSRSIQAELNACRERIHQLTQGKHTPYAAYLSEAAAFLKICYPNLTVLTILNTEGERINCELAECRARAAELKAELEAIWADETRAEYELTAAFIHRGASPTFGHYFIYQRWLPDHKDEWFKYNDSDVSTATKEEVLADTTGSIANPYLLVFSRKGSQVIETVRRVDPMVVE